jgi:hypothetical protein
MKPNIEINIEELVLHGFKPGDRYDIGKSLEIELVRLFSEQGVPGVLSENKNLGKVDAGTFNASSNSKAESIGTQIANSVYKEFIP